MVELVSALFASAVFGPLLLRRASRWGHWILAAAPGAAFVYFAGQLHRLSAGETLRHARSWVAFLDLDVAFRLDGLSCTFALLITGIGTLVVIYSGGYRPGKTRTHEFQGYLLAFTAAMLAIVLADNIIVLYIAWELTTLTSYALIGFEVEDEEARRSARQALLVTSGGGLAMLAGLLMAASAAGSFALSDILAARSAFVESENYAMIVVLVAFGALAKSAIFPFHFWLPNAMAAPTPASAFLHSATMVKAGLYLLARLRPALGDTDVWFYTLIIPGAMTVVVAGVAVLRSSKIKAVLAHTTLIALGSMTMLLGLPGTLPIHAFATYLVVHALYKAPLFLVAGILSKRTSAEHIEELRKLTKVLPITVACAVLAALAQIGVYPTLGFVGKELVYEAFLHASQWQAFFAGVAIWGFSFNVTGALLVVWPLVAGAPPDGEQIRRPGIALWSGAAVLSSLGLLLGPLNDGVAWNLVDPLTHAVEPNPDRANLALWKGVKPPLVLSLVSIALGIAAYRYRAALRSLLCSRGLRALPSADAVYETGYRAVNRFAELQTAVIQHGVLRRYQAVVLVTLAAALCLPFASSWRLPSGQFEGVRAMDLVLVSAVAAGVLLAAVAKGRLLPVLAVSFVGLVLAAVFVLFGAPDVALTQFAVETLLLVAVVVAVGGMNPELAEPRSTRRRGLDAVLSALVGAGVTFVLLLVLEIPFDATLSERVADQSVPEAHGHNLVNVILVDFRAFDTLGEISVLVAAGLGAAAVLHVARVGAR